jgi:hypothetical protein
MRNSSLGTGEDRENSGAERHDRHDGLRGAAWMTENLRHSAQLPGFGLYPR